MFFVMTIVTPIIYLHVLTSYKKVIGVAERKVDSEYYYSSYSFINIFLINKYTFFCLN
jgi:hypothetical protein